MAFQWASAFRIFTITSATSEATDYPASRVATLDSHPLIRTWRSTATTQQDLILDAGSILSFEAVTLLNSNFSLVQLAHSADNVSYSDFAGSAFPMNKHLADGYRKLFRAQSISNRYVRVRIPAQTPIDGAAYFSLGLVLIVQTLNTLPFNPIEPLNQSLDRPYLRSGREVTPVGPFSIEQEWQTLADNANVTQLQNIALLGEHTPVLVFENNGNSQEVYLMRYVGAMRFARHGLTYGVNPTWQEMA